MNKILYFLIIILRILFSPMIFIMPLISIILSFFLDIIDVEFASRSNITLDQYEFNDKALDLWWYLNAMAFSWFYLPDYKLLLLSLFVFRIIGDVIFFIKNDRRIFLLFPNFFENIFFLIYFSIYFKQLSFLLDKKYFLIAFLVLSIIKIIQEWWVHIAQISIPEDFFGKKRNWKK